MNDHLLRTCEICQQPLPIAGVGQRRKICLNLDCARERKRRAQAKWRANNPDYFKGRYGPHLKDWLAAHPGYLKRWRQTRAQLEPLPQPAPAVRDIQVEISPCSNAARGHDGDIQVKITCKIHNAVRVRHAAHEDIQVSQTPLPIRT